MQTIQLLKWYNRTDMIISQNNSEILEYKKLAMLYLGDGEADKRKREMCISAARKIKAESDQLIKEKEELTNSIKQLPQKYRQALEMFYINGFPIDACCTFMGCNKNIFYFLKKEAVQELERKMEENAHSDI